VTDDHNIECAAAILTDALIEDPFYAAISVDFESESVARREVLTDYFHYSLREGYEIGAVTLDAHGAAIWTLPQPSEVAQSAAKAKHAAFTTLLGLRGLAHYRAIIDFMEPTAHSVVPEGSWYLSILGVAPSQQGRGLGRALLEPTLQQADAAQVPCFLETYNAASLRFYERLGFAEVADHIEPTMQARYWIMVREPQAA
jgi:ribosomal protein S18 acetylase RimI-like enzyme